MADAVLSDQVILVTGAANGLGAAVAKGYATQGATVILLDKDVAGLEATYDQIYPAHAQPAIYPLDMKGASVEDYQQMVTTITQQFGRLDALVHCAAILGQLAPLAHQDPRQWAETLHINLTAPFLITQACLPLLQQQTKASILFTSDQHQGQAYWSAYGISKAGIATLAKQLEDELAAQGRVAVHCIEPDHFQSQLFSRAFPALDPNDYPSADDVIAPYLAALDCG